MSLLTLISVAIVISTGVRPSLEDCTGLKLLRTGNLSCNEKQVLLDLHNTLRAKVAGGELEKQPQAQDMIELRWENKLENRAQKWANTCNFFHDKNVLTDDGDYVGQNIARRWTPSNAESANPNLADLVGIWSDEYKNGYTGVFTPTTGHYSQMIWGSTRSVGCGLVSFANGSLYTNLLVCDYQPGGNVVGVTPYKYGAKNCSASGLFNSLNYKTLCAIDEKRVGVC